jgi:teichuronic acid biosynthesis glycosyltransferase TuaC
VAHRVGGIPEVLVSEELGVLVEDNTPESLARGIQKGLEKNWDANLCIEYARRFTWDRISRKYFEIFDSLYP